MLALVIVLVATNLATLALLAWRRVRPQEHPAPDRTLAASLDAAHPAVSTTSIRRVITIEILNPIELAGTRGRLAGIAGSLVPGITRRIVYDQTIKTLRRQLVDEQVVADVRLHHLRPQGGDEPARSVPVLVEPPVPGPAPEPGPPSA